MNFKLCYSDKRVGLIKLCAAVFVGALAIAGARGAENDHLKKMDPLHALSEPDSGRGLSADPASVPTHTWVLDMQDQLEQLKGSGYRYGSSSSKTGFDCSGLVVYVFSKLGLPELPRSASGMAQKGVRVEPGELQFGDLVFFNTRGRMYSHVGIYTGNGRFVHAATMNRRVMESSLSEPYYRTRFNGARRVIGTL